MQDSVLPHPLVDLTEINPTREMPSAAGALSGLVGDVDPEQESFHGRLPDSREIEEEINHVMELELSRELQGWVRDYSGLGDRNPFLWNWCRRAVELVTLPCVTSQLRDELCDTKTLGVMFDVLLDDVADRNGSEELLEELLKLPLDRSALQLSRLSDAERKYARFTGELWQEITSRARRYPYYDEYADLLRFDYLQLCNTMRYSHLVNADLKLLNMTEHDIYTPYNMHIMICSTFDLMCSPGFNRLELGRLREVVWTAQHMGRCGNLVTTWERELREGDFTSGVFAHAVAEGDLSMADLRLDNRDGIEAAIRNGRHEEFFLDRWRNCLRFLLSEKARLQSFDVHLLARGLRKLICLHLGSRGKK